MGHPIHKHMHTHITKQNVKAAIKDDKAHMDYLKRDVKDDQRAGGKYKDINQTADEKHISKLAGDVKYDEKKEGMSRYEYEGMSRHTSEHSTEEYMSRKDAAIKKAKGMSRESAKKERKDLNRYNPVDDRASGPRVGDVKPGTITPTGGSPYKDKKKKAGSKKPGTRVYGK